MTFDGKLEGDINSDGTLNLGDNAVVKGNINVSAAIVMRGKVNGNVIASEKLDIKSKTELFGDIEPEAGDRGRCDFVGKTEVNPNKVAPSANGNASTVAESPAARATEPAKAGRF